MQTLEQDLAKSFLYLERLNPKSVEIIQGKLNVAKENILSAVANTNNQREIRKIIKKELSSAFETFDEMVLDDIEDITELSWNATGKILTLHLANEIKHKFVKFDDVDDIIKKQLTNPKQLIMGNNLSDYKNNFIYSANNKLRGAILQGIDAKVGIDEITRNTDGVISNLARNQVRTVVRTATLSAINQAKSVQFEQLDIDGAIYYYNAVMDSRTSKRCFTLNNFRSKDMKDITRLLNYHYNCRSMLGITTQNILDYQDKNPQTKKVVQWNDDKTVHHRDGTNSTKFKVDSIRYANKNGSSKQFFDAFDEKFKEKYVGKKNYKLYKENKISYDEMIGVTRNNLISKDKLSKSLEIDTPKTKVPNIDFGYNGKFNGYVRDIRDEAKIVIDKLPKPNNIKPSKVNGKFSAKDNSLTTPLNKNDFNHEYGHFIDKTLGGDAYLSEKRLFSASKRDGENLGLWIDGMDKTGELVSKRLSKMKSILEEYYTHTSGKGTRKVYKINENKYIGLIDIYDSLSQGWLRDKYIGVHGHGKGYFSVKKYRMTENFANLYEIYSNNEIWDDVKKILPNMTKEFELIMKEVIDGKFD